MSDMEIFDNLPPRVRRVLNDCVAFKYKAESAAAALEQVGESELIRQLAEMDMNRRRMYPQAVDLKWRP